MTDNQKVESQPNSPSIIPKNSEEGRLYKSSLFSAFSGIISTIFGVKTRKEPEDTRNITEKKGPILKPIEQFRSDAAVQITKRGPNDSKVSTIPSVPINPSALSIPSRFEISINLENGDEIEEYLPKSSSAKDGLKFAGPRSDNHGRPISYFGSADVLVGWEREM